MANVDPMNDNIKQKINQLITNQLNDYESNYNSELGNVSSEWTKQGINFSWPELDKEAHNRAGVDSFKTNISKEIWNSVQTDIDNHIKTKTKNEMVIKASNTAGKKAVDTMVDDSVNEGLKKISKNAQDKNQSSN